MERDDGPRWAPFAALLVLVAFVWSDLFSATRLLDLRLSGHFSDALDSYYPLFHFFSTRLKGGVWPLWCPLILNGTPFLASQIGPFYPPNFIAAAALSPVTGYGLALFSGYACAAAAMYAYGRRVGLDKWSSAFSGLVFCGFGFFVGHAAEQNIVKTAAWLPLLGAAAHDLSNSRWRNGVLLGAAAFGLQWTAASPQLTYYSGLAFALAAAVGSATARRPRWSALAAAVAASAALGAALGAVALLPTAEQAARSFYGSADHLAEARRLTLSIGHLARLFVRDRSPFFPEAEVFLGFTPLILAAFGLRRVWADASRRPAAAALTAVAAFGFIGCSFGLASYWRLLPGFHLFRFPVRMLLLPHFALSAFAGFGLDAARTRLRGIRRWAAAAATVVVLLATAAESRSYIVSRTHVVDAPSVGASAELVAAVRRNIGEGRMYPFDPAYLGLGMFRTAPRRDFPDRRLMPNANCLDLIPSVLGLDILAPESVMTMQSAAATYQGEFSETKTVWRPSARWTRVLALQGTTLVVSPWDISAPGLTEVSRADDAVLGRAVKIYTVAHPLPPARLVHTAEVFDEYWKTLPRALDADFDPFRAALLERAPGPLAPAAGPESVRSTRDGPDAREWEVTASGDALLIVDQSFDPGWRATVDGATTPLLKADYAFTALRVPAGRHRVSLVFSPVSFRVGLAMTVLAALALFAGAWTVLKASSRRA